VVLATQSCEGRLGVQYDLGIRKKNKVGIIALYLEYGISDQLKS
jgi:hypothetical protein